MHGRRSLASAHSCLLRALPGKSYLVAFTLSSRKMQLMAATSVAAPEVERFTCTQFLPLLPVAALTAIGLVGHPSGADLDPRFCKSAHIIPELSEFKLRYKNNYLDQKGNRNKLLEP